ncbi:coiled-coil domain-containing protein 97 [Toxorhynchites rutilus septentrionalis]|uniref:coiled-coil domain-containing protein 97 n=1 Tax=Toxorhynchites rutilus septentrionalis TaxID=329112 RepID=UPI00247ACEB5|nr:coiled-coil domain-containing protein 97 [Toxorhynchites rutilus septentrionalis]
MTVSQTEISLPVPVLESDLIAHVSSDERVFYKSQQVNDPELTILEKRDILKRVLDTSYTTFLSRFGLFIKEDHLRFFEQEQQVSGYSPDERYEVDYYLEKIRKSLHGGRERDIRNRRYAALKQMIHEGNYFSEVEMMQREPLIYEQLVGQYLTENEKKARDATGTKNDSLVTILYNGIDKENADLLRKEQETEEKQMDEEVDDDGDEDSHETRDSPGFSLAQWGNFDLEEEERQKSRQLEQDAHQRKKKYSTPVNMLTAGERTLLRDEFLGTMYSKFISGEDKDFDYSKIDESTEYDNLDIVEQDEQEKYFDTEDVEESNEITESMQHDNSEEDDLDVYMRHINQHLDNQKKMGQMNHTVKNDICEYDSD